MSTHSITPATSGTNRRKRSLTFNPAAEIIRNEHVPLVTGLSSTSIWRYRRAGKFPPAIQLGQNSVGFRRTDLDRWLTARETSSETATA